MTFASLRAAWPLGRAAVALLACAACEPATTRPAALAELSPATLPPPPADVTNRYADDAAAAALGQRLFFDPAFSGPLLDSDNDGSPGSLGARGESGKVSCAACHVAAGGFVDTRSPRQQVSLAAAWGKRKAPTLLDVGHAKLLMWDGRRDAAYNQPIAAIESGVEMNSSRLHAAQQIYRRHRAEYEAVFGAIPVPLDDAARFPQLDGSTTGCRRLLTDGTGLQRAEDCHGVPGDHAEFDALSASDQTAVTRIAVNLGKAIAAYERRLACGAGRFDRWMHGDDGALDASEQRGASLFVSQGCTGCHSGPFFSDQRFHNVGVQPRGVGIASSFIDVDDHGARDGLAGALADPLNVRGSFSDGDDGRLPVQVGAEMDGAFRTPTLRCVSLRPSFLHDGQARSLHDAVAFFAAGGDAHGYPGKNELAPLELTAGELDDLVAFLDTLTGPGPDAPLLVAPP